MAKKRLKPKVEGREPNDLCICGSGVKYKRCCGIHQKGTGRVPRISVKREQKQNKGELLKQTADIARFDLVQRMMAERRARRME